jgi:hypothetical protein
MLGVWLGAVPIAAGSSTYSCQKLDDFNGPTQAHTDGTGDGRPSGRVHIAEDTIDAEKFRELANLIDEILPALELSADQREHLKVGAAEIRVFACAPNTKPEALRQALEGVLRLQPTRSKPAQKVDKDKQ